jgi:hypothetical protein
MYKVLKVFDCQEMPDHLCKHFLKLWDDKCNDVAIDWRVCDSDPPIPEHDIIDQWLLSNGAVIGEEVIIKYWW